MLGRTPSAGGLLRARQEVEICDLRRLVSSFAHHRDSPDFPCPWIPTGTGRAALALILGHLRATGVCIDRNSPVLVPRWLSIPVLETMRKYCTPTCDGRAPARATVIHHQCGFPQDLDAIRDICEDRGMILVEDCVHAFEGWYKGSRLGTFGLASIFSLAKMFPSICGGGLATSDSELQEHALRQQQELGSDFVATMLQLAKYVAERRPEAPPGWAEALLAMTGSAAERAQASPVADRIAWREFRAGALKRRRRNYQLLRQGVGTLPWFDHLERDDVTPFVAPLIAPSDVLRRISSALTSRSYAATTQQFDVNRNLFAPNFQECVWVPLHQGLSDDNMDEICAVIRGSVDG